MTPHPSIYSPRSTTTTVFVLAQVDVGAKTGQAPRLPVRLDGVNLVDVVGTADAAHAQRATAGFLPARGGHYVLTVKRKPAEAVRPAHRPALQIRYRSVQGPATAATAGSSPAP